MATLAIAAIPPSPRAWIHAKQSLASIGCPERRQSNSAAVVASPGRNPASSNAFAIVSERRDDRTDLGHPGFRRHAVHVVHHQHDVVAGRRPRLCGFPLGRRVRHLLHRHECPKHVSQLLVSSSVSESFFSENRPWSLLGCNKVGS
jgi:hypothetical protein